jgi:hypothetical protein
MEGQHGALENYIKTAYTFTLIHITHVAMMIQSQLQSQLQLQTYIQYDQ